jgi:hypothetical protein
LLLALTSGASPVSPPKLAALDWTAANVERELVSFFSEELARALRQRGLKVVTSSDMAALLGAERRRQLLGCDESGCLAELGNALGCEGLLMVSLAKLSGTWRANLKVLSSKDGATLVEAQVESSSDNGFVRELDGAAARMATALAPGAPPGVTAGAPARRVAWIPAVAGAVVVLAGGVLLGLAISSSKALDQELSSQQSVTPRAAQLARDGKAFQAGGWAGVGVGAAALVVAAAMALFGGDAPMRPVVSLTPRGASFGLTVEWP